MDMFLIMVVAENNRIQRRLPPKKNLKLLSVRLRRIFRIFSRGGLPRPGGAKCVRTIFRVCLTSSFLLQFSILATASSLLLAVSVALIRLSALVPRLAQKRGFASAKTS